MDEEPEWTLRIIARVVRFKAESRRKGNGQAGGGGPQIPADLPLPCASRALQLYYESMMEMSSANTRVRPAGLTPLHHRAGNPQMPLVETSCHFRTIGPPYHKGGSIATITTLPLATEIKVMVEPLYNSEELSQFFFEISSKVHTWHQIVGIPVTGDAAIVSGGESHCRAANSVVHRPAVCIRVPVRTFRTEW